LKENMGPQIRVSVADPTPLILAGYQRLFELEKSIAMVAAVTSLHLLERSLAGADSPDVVIVDWTLIPQDSVSLGDLIRSTSSKTKLLLVAWKTKVPDIRSALLLGARGVLQKHAPSHEIVAAVQKVASGGLWIDKHTAEAVIDLTYGQHSENEDAEKRLRRLTLRERQVLCCVEKGMRNKAIASELNIAQTTVTHHLSSIFLKLQIDDRYALMSFANWHQIAIRNCCGRT